MFPLFSESIELKPRARDKRTRTRVVIHFFILTHMVEVHSYELRRPLRLALTARQKRDRTRVLEYPRALRRHSTGTAFRERAGTSRSRPSHTAHTESHGLKPRDLPRNLSQQNTRVSRARPRGRTQSWRPYRRRCPPRKRLPSTSTVLLSNFLPLSYPNSVPFVVVRPAKQSHPTRVRMSDWDYSSCD